MIQSNELRIGNYFRWSIIASLGRVDVITKENHYSHNELRDPILLTEDWMLKFGFKADEIGHLYLNLEDTFYGFVNREEEGFMLVVCGIEYKETYIKHVHQLQNLYFALNNEELAV